jgi:hypothetical protein
MSLEPVYSLPQLRLLQFTLGSLQKRENRDRAGDRVKEGYRHDADTTTRDRIVDARQADAAKRAAVEMKGRAKMSLAEQTERLRIMVWHGDVETRAAARGIALEVAAEVEAAINAATQKDEGEGTRTARISAYPAPQDGDEGGHMMG